MLTTELKPEVRITVKGDRALLPLNRALIIGPQQSSIRILPIRVLGDGVRGIVSVNQIPGLLVSVSWADTGIVRLQIFNSTEESRMLSAKICLVAVVKLKEAVFVKTGVDAPIVAAMTPASASIDVWQKKYPRVFQPPRFDYDGRATGLTVTKDEIEWRIPFHRIPMANRGLSYGSGEVTEEEAYATLREMAEQGVIRRLNPEEHAFFSPVLWIRKPNGAVRPTIDLRLLNQYSVTWKNVNPGVLSTLRSIPADWKIYTVLDIASGFHHLPICADLQRLFAFEAAGRRWTYRVLPQGWSSSPGLFSSRVRSVLEDTTAIAYADDVLVGGSNAQNHDSALHAVLDRMTAYGLQLNPKKVRLAQAAVIFLGYDVCDGTLGLQTYINRQIHRLPQATTTTQIRKMLGIFNVLRPTCRNLSRALEPLQHELQKPATERVSLPQLQAMTNGVWDHVLHKNTQIMLVSPGPQTWHLQVDWSGIGTGYAIWAGPPDEGRLVGLGSVRMSSTASSMLGELRALVWALKQTNELTAGQQVVVETDSESAYKRVRRHPTNEALEDVRVIRLLQWLTANFGGRLTVNFIPAEFNRLADLLSRWNTAPENGGEGERIQQITGPDISNPSPEEKLQRFHTAHRGHWGTRRSWIHLKRDGPIWPNARSELFDFVARCPTCQHYADPTDSEVWTGLHSTTVGQIVTADFFGPVRWKQGQRRFGLLIIDAFSRYVQILPCVKPTAKNVIRGLTQWQTRFEAHGYQLQTLLTDNGAGFISADVRRWTQSRRIIHPFSSPYAPWSNGLAERAIGTVKGRLQRIGREGPLRIPEVEEIINSAVHRATGYSPNELVWGRKRDGTIASAAELQQWRQSAATTQLQLRRETAQKWQLKRRQKGPALRIGDTVLLYQPERRRHALDSAWSGPYRLRAQSSRVQWILEDLISARRIPGFHHANRLRIFRSAQGSDVVTAAIMPLVRSKSESSLPRIRASSVTNEQYITHDDLYTRLL